MYYLTKMPIARYSNAYCKKLYICSNQSQAVENTSKVQKKKHIDLKFYPLAKCKQAMT